MTDAVHEWPLGERVREARGEESQRAVARRAEVSPEVLWQVENGRRRDGLPFKRPTVDIVKKIARALHIPVDEALNLAGYRPEDHLAPESGLEVQLARKVAKLQPAQQRALETLIDGLLVARGHVGANSGVDVMVRSAGEEVRYDVESRGEPVNGATPVRQPQED